VTATKRKNYDYDNENSWIDLVDFPVTDRNSREGDGRKMRDLYKRANQVVLRKRANQVVLRGAWKTPSLSLSFYRFWFLVCYTATQLATLLQQRRIQVGRSNKVARKRLTESNGTPTLDLERMKVVLQ